VDFNPVADLKSTPYYSDNCHKQSRLKSMTARKESVKRSALGMHVRGIDLRQAWSKIGMDKKVLHVGTNLSKKILKLVRNSVLMNCSV
jgi:hypothetical protein